MSDTLTNKLYHFYQKRGFWMVVFLPSSLALLYSLFLAAPQYSSDSRALVKESDSSSATAIPGMLNLIGAPSTSKEDADILYEYLNSAKFLSELVEHFNISEHFSSPETDFWNRLGADASFEDLLEYYRNKINITISSDSSIMTIETTAFSPEMAFELNQFILKRSEEEINKLNRIIAREQTKVAQEELNQKKEELIQAENALLEFQHRYGVVDATSEAGALFARIGNLEAVLTEKKAELKRVRAYIRDDAFQVKALEQEIAAIEKQLLEENAELVGQSDSSMLPIIRGYKRLRLEQEFATQAYASAFAALESSKIDVSRQEKFLLVIAPPVLPEDTSAPRPLVTTLTTLVVALLLYGILSLIIATILDHQV